MLDPRPENGGFIVDIVGVGVYSGNCILGYRLEGVWDPYEIDGRSRSLYQLVGSSIGVVKAVSIVFFDVLEPSDIEENLIRRTCQRCRNKNQKRAILSIWISEDILCS